MKALFTYIRASRAGRAVALSAVALTAAVGGISMLGGHAEATPSLPSLGGIGGSFTLPSTLPTNLPTIPVDLGQISNTVHNAKRTGIEAGINGLCSGVNAIPAEQREQILSQLPAIQFGDFLNRCAQ